MCLSWLYLFLRAIANLFIKSTMDQRFMARRGDLAPQAKWIWRCTYSIASTLRTRRRCFRCAEWYRGPCLVRSRSLFVAQLLAGISAVWFKKCALSKTSRNLALSFFWLLKIYGSSLNIGALLKVVVCFSWFLRHAAFYLQDKFSSLIWLRPRRSTHV